MEPWIALKNEGYDLVISAIHAQFKEYAELGYPDDDAATVAALEHNRAVFDALTIEKEPRGEKEARNIALTHLTRREVDLVWLLDGDEFYTKEQIVKIIEFVKKTPQFDYYHVPLDNRIFSNIRWQDGMAPPRIFRTDRHGGVGGFVWDNEVMFGDGTLATTLLPGIIPTRIAHVRHETWQRKDLEKKIAYHKKHFGYSPFRIDESGNPLFDEAYLAQHEMQMTPLMPGGTALALKPTLEVFFRSHSTGNFRGGMLRVTDELGGKQELTVRALRSLIYALLVLARANMVHIRLTVIDDHSDQESLTRIKKELEVCPFETEVVELAGSGNSASLRAAFDRAKNGKNDLIYFVEDDYLHERSSMIEMVEAHRAFSRNVGSVRVGIFPVDELDRYTESISPSRVVLGTRRHWRTIGQTTGTFMISRTTLEEKWTEISSLATGENNEQTSINPVWQDHTIMFSPIPTLAYHMNTEERMPPFSSWRKLWNSLSA
jgi:hypothetical protein